MYEVDAKADGLCAGVDLLQEDGGFLELKAKG